MLPERDSSGFSTARGRQLAEHLGIQYEVFDIAPALEGIGCYQQRDEAIRRVFPEYGDGWKNKIVISGGLEGRINHFKLVVQTPAGEMKQERLGLREYLQIVAATNYKQRIRKTVEYFHADRLNYAVIGTPNRLEYDQGFFVKNGDGSADVKPIAHLYKTQVYALARHLELPPEICDADADHRHLQPGAGPGRVLFRAAVRSRWTSRCRRSTTATRAEELGARRSASPRSRPPTCSSDIEAKRARHALHAPASRSWWKPVAEIKL